VKRLRVLAAVSGVLASVACAGPASAFSPPELFVRMQPWDTHEPVSDWIPLASSPVLNYLGGYQVGYRLQASGQAHEFQRVAMTIARVPDGSPSQPFASPPYCVGRAGTAGEIVDAAAELQFEGDGAYTVTVSVGGGSEGSTDCLSGPSTTASFSVDVHVAPELVGRPVNFRAVPPPTDAFAGVRAAAPPGGQADNRCALDAAVQPDGSVSGPAVVPEADGSSHATIPESTFTRPGVWTCVARGTAEGRDENFDTATFGTPWSAPIAVEVRSDFRRRAGSIARGRSRRPRFTFKAEWAALAAGGRARVTLYRLAGCRGTDFKLRKLKTYRGRFGPKRVRVRVRRPRAGFYIGRFAFSGTHFLRASVDPIPMLLVANRRRMGFASTFPRCPGYQP
jgi:hypothetical protein